MVVEAPPRKSGDADWQQTAGMNYGGQIPYAFASTHPS